VPLTLPPSFDRNRHGVDEEVAWARTLSPEERLAVVASLCRDAVQLLLLNDKRDRVLSLRDPVPESTKRALARLRTAR
jgi:hypothetical protein